MRRHRTRSSSARCIFIRRSRNICRLPSSNWRRSPRRDCACPCKPYSGDLSESFTNSRMAARRNWLSCLKGFVYVATYVQEVALEHLAAADAREALIREVRRGLIARPRSLSPWMFYDAEGSRLFERITTLPEYYPTRTERAILARHADAIVARAHNAGSHRDRSLPLRLVELGAGTASKTCI